MSGLSEPCIQTTPISGVLRVTPRQTDVLSPWMDKSLRKMPTEKNSERKNGDPLDSSVASTLLSETAPFCCSRTSLTIPNQLLWYKPHIPNSILLLLLVLLLWVGLKWGWNCEQSSRKRDAHFKEYVFEWRVVFQIWSFVWFMCIWLWLCFLKVWYLVCCMENFSRKIGTKMD